MQAPALISPQVAQMLRYIRDHGHAACYAADNDLLAVTNPEGITEFLLPDWVAIRHWLGY